MTDPQRCPKCGMELPADAPAELCPQCLLGLGLAAHSVSCQGEFSDGAESTLSHGDGDRDKPIEASLADGVCFGGYRIVRRLGRGGMGTVYEAEQLENGRRVALKILQHRLESPEARRRFLREGRLAASVNHPNSVYVYGTEEVEDRPTISMELAGGGTLQQRVHNEGALPPDEAVDAILQVIAGLEAAHAKGVLHRDVKPANCFIDNDGTVKVGDFGLSISTLPRGESHLTIDGEFLGTPAFSSPEQLRGDELSVRSDIYAVGVTLYYLITGRTPFEAKNMVQLLARALESPPMPLTSPHGAVPKGLAKVVLRCLEKRPDARYADYDELRRALQPFSSVAPTPATLGWRFLAAAMDIGIGSLVFWAVALIPFFARGQVSGIPFLDPDAMRHAVWFSLVSLVIWVCYYGLSEGIWGASPGKALCRLRIVLPHSHESAGLRQAFIRAFIYIVLPGIGNVTYAAWMASQPDFGQGSIVGQLIGSVTPLVLMALLFSTMRRQNGFAGLHDLGSGTRVIQRVADQRRPAVFAQEEALTELEATPKIGPYFILDRLYQTDSEELTVGYDAQLLRKVWIHRSDKHHDGELERARNARRAGRLHWLNGRHRDDESWDAYEAPTGRPLTSLLNKPSPWHQVRYWLVDIAEELQAGLQDDSLPVDLSLDRVWITGDGQAKLLDFRAPGVTGWGADAGASQDHHVNKAALPVFLNQVAIATLEGTPVSRTEASQRTVAAPLPLRARKVIDQLLTETGPDLPIRSLTPLVQQVPMISRARRVGVLLGCLMMPFFTTLMFIASYLINQPLVEQHPEVLRLRDSLFRLEALEKRENTLSPKQQLNRSALTTFVAGQSRDLMADPTVWKTLSRRGIMLDRNQRLAERIVAERPEPTAQEFAEAKGMVQDLLGDRTHLLGFPPVPFSVLAGMSNLLIFVAIPSLACALLFRGGPLLRAFGIAIVNRRGNRASRIRLFWRSLVTWSPLALAFPVLAMFCNADRMAVLWGIPLFTCGLYLAISLISTLIPVRGLADRVSGTYLVPR